MSVQLYPLLFVSKYTSVEDVGTPAPPAPPLVAAQLLALLQSVVPAPSPPTQYRCRVSEEELEELKLLLKLLLLELLQEELLLLGTYVLI